MKTAIVEGSLLLTGRKLKSIIGNPEKCAKAANLLYVHDSDMGLKRIKKGQQFMYVDKELKPVRDKATLERIHSLGIPPAWNKVWICDLENGHLQATGFDAKNRKQYIYHPLWYTLRNHTKFYRMLQFGEVIPAIRSTVDKDLARAGLPLEKVLALVVRLMEFTHIRVGNSAYEKLYGSFGLTTLKDKHVQIKGDKLKIAFKGKKGVYHDISIKNKRLAKMVQACRDIPGKELFQYYTPEGDRKAIDSSMVNAYIRSISGDDFTAKDFRTWSGTIHAFLALKELGGFDKAGEAKKKVMEALDIVSSHLGNSRNVCKKYYVHPMILTMYETGALDKYLLELDQSQPQQKGHELAVEEKIVLKILKSN